MFSISFFPGERSSENLQNMGIHGNDGPNSAVLPLQAHGSSLRPSMGQHRCMGFDYLRSATLHYDVLSRLCRHTLQRGYSKFGNINLNRCLK